MWLTFHSMSFFTHIQLGDQWRLFKFCFAKSGLFLICMQLIIPQDNVLHLSSLRSYVLFFPEIFSWACQDTHESFWIMFSVPPISPPKSLQSPSRLVESADITALLPLPSCKVINETMSYTPSQENPYSKQSFFHFENRPLIPSFIFYPQ